MGDSPDEVAIVEVRSVRRRLTQSTLFPHKVQENSAEKDNGSDCEDMDCGGSQGKRKRKGKGKDRTTPKAKLARKTNTKGMESLNGVGGSQDSPVSRSMTSPRKPRENKQSNSTPKKTKAKRLVDPGLMLTSTSPLPSEGKTKIIPNLRLEAKLLAEENCRVFGGKQIHPFFTARKPCKITQDAAETENNKCTGDRNNVLELSQPIHVFDSAQDGEPLTDWSHWIFLERPLFNGAHQMNNCIDFSNTLDTGRVSSPPPLLSRASGVVGSHIPLDRNSSPCLISTNENYVEQIMGDAKNYEYCLDEMKNSTTSYNSRDNNVLWTKKYQPDGAAEVCGNTVSVSYLSEWLQLWHAKALQCRESATRGTENTCLSGDLDYCESDCDSEKFSQGAKLKNVLLVSGPTGSGKSASIYACAKEHGFNVIEVNTSDWRNGALVKQKFGEAVESHCVKRLNEGETIYKEQTPGSFNRSEMSQEADNEAVELRTVAVEDGTGNSINIFSKVPCDKVQLRTLVLFEDVDIAFTEDRGFISAIHHLARTAKLPIILTTNSNQSSLPDTLEREEICFSWPSLQDLLGLVTEICTAENANIEPSQLPSFIEFFHGDIRKTIMHLQFWCQNAARIKDVHAPLQENSDPQVLDLESAHQLLMKFIPCDFASELSELIELELNKTLRLQEEYSTLVEVEGSRERYLSDIRQQSVQAHLNEECMAAKKDEMLKRNTYYEQFEAEAEAQDLSNSSGSHIIFTRRNIHRKSDYVLSLSGDNEMFDDDACPTISSQEMTHAGDNHVECRFMTPSTKPAENYNMSIVHTSGSLNPIDKNLTLQPGEKFEGLIQDSENCLQIWDSCGVIDMSCVPESSFVPETRMNDEHEESCRSVAYAPAADIFTTVDVECYDECLSRLHADTENVIRGFDINVESLHLEDVADSHTELLEESTRGWQIMDECSQMIFKREPTQRQQNDGRKLIGKVQEAWNILRDKQQDLRKYVIPDEKYVSQILKVASGSSNLISEADILLSNSRLAKNTFAEQITMPSEKSDTFQWCNEQLQMASTFFDRGMHLYAKETIAFTSNIDNTCLADPEQGMLTNISDTIKIGNACAQGAEILECRPRVCAPSEREANTSCIDIIQSIVPSRSYLALRGEAMNEYVSSLNTISRSETSRLSAGIDKGKRRRGRPSRHYLSAEFSLSQEDISLLNQYRFGSHQEDA